MKSNSVLLLTRYNTCLWQYRHTPTSLSLSGVFNHGWKQASSAATVKSKPLPELEEDVNNARPFSEIPGPKGLPYIGTTYEYRRGMAYYEIVSAVDAAVVGILIFDIDVFRPCVKKQLHCQIKYLFTF